jgi:hypothetical protein
MVFHHCESLLRPTLETATTILVVAINLLASNKFIASTVPLKKSKLCITISIDLVGF